MLLYLVNFIVITTSILLFILPFFVWYWLGHREKLSLSSFNFYVENFFSSRQANWLIFAWAAGEAVVWFVIPEFLLLLIVFMRIRKKRLMLLYDVAGTVFGTIVALLMRLPEHAISSLPYIQDRMVSQTKTWYNEMGIMGLVNQPFSGVPYKVFTHLAWQYKYHLLAFLVVAVAVRIVRYLIAYGLFLSLYPKLHHVVRRNYVPLFFIAIFIFSILLLKTYNAYS